MLERNIMEESNNQPPQDWPEWESPFKKLWKVLMFQRLILPALLKAINLLVLVSAIISTAGIVFAGRNLPIILLFWMYVIAIRIASELVLLGYDFLIQRTQSK
jgi:hypothetical protein